MLRKSLYFLSAACCSCIAVFMFYLGFVEMLIGGIVDIINEIKAPETSAFNVAFAILKIALFEIPIVAGIIAVKFALLLIVSVAFKK